MKHIAIQRRFLLPLLLLLISCLIFPGALSAQGELQLRLGTERVVLETDFGDLVLAFYPDIAPNHIAQIQRLVELGAYDGTHFHRLEDGFVMQLSDISHRVPPATPEQKAAEKKLRGEFSVIPHTLGKLSMARWDDPHSATSSFSILLGRAPHLDRKYTIFGELESGGDTVEAILRQPREGSTPRNRITVRRAYILKNPQSYYQTHAKNPLTLGNLVKPTVTRSTPKGRNADASEFPHHAYLLIAIIAICLAGFFGYEKFEKRIILSLLMLNALVSGLVLFILLLPVGQHNQTLAAFLFVGLLGLFKFMNRFESKE